ncbi:dihydroneopterin aldolase [Aureicoccus marinus]|uniref:7,8-dihydroneopterin aldolase n=1 Tax=Aureicoccus marinus TaxID=754435 RepID=A0A2S7T8J9_9FLAO|nr:dihydroneopterin aldolase [Aureicoccus marinus]PQJ16259.1 dihydroneopterin aldolase [Aureicoccus marinus]
MGIIRVNTIRVHAWHGCLKEESIIGSEYTVDVELETDLKQSSRSDQLQDTVDYVHVHQIVKEEMAIKSKLLEHVAQRILDRFFEELHLLDKAQVAVSKINPPIGGDVASVTIVMEQSRASKIKK